MMKKLFLAAIAVLISLCPNFGQFTTVTYDLDRNWFNEGQPLPAEKSMIFKGTMPDGTEMVELNILSSKRNDQLYKAVWQRLNNNEIAMTVPFKLRSSDEYDFRFDLFNATTQKERTKMLEELTATLDTYVDVNLTGEKNIKLLKGSKKTMKDLNSILENALSHFRSKTLDWQPAFSEIIHLKLEQLEKADLDKNYIKRDSASTKKSVRNTTRQELVSSLKDQAGREAKQMLDADLLVLTASRFIDDYTTVEKLNSLAVNVGYGGVFLSGDWDDFTYGASAYLGLAFPLGNSVLGSKFLSNTSVTLGVFLENFEDEDGNKVTGFLVDRPIYLGLDHKLFKFIRVNAGASFLEGTKVSGVPDVGNSTTVMVRPYIGLSARIDLSIGLGK